ncbi:cyclic nucleotide-gated ion channel 1-like [Quercus robur]|uniref:cyclic nucleotide-gated ion channel 1-like n=1 Tax=Quercus robur TaxID=38942 RepID=UPI0021629E00|nr:cyclic nucleotide-gated ion channel 1-like [Quercus robur]
MMLRLERQDERNEAEDGGPLVLGSSSSMKIRDRWFLQSWRIIFGVSCVIAVALDPLFFYVPVINEDKKCIGIDKKLRAISLILRSVTDIIGIINIILQFHDEYTHVDETSGKVVKDFRKKAKTYLWPYFVIDILVILPFPQVIILIIFRQLEGSKSLNKRKLLTFFVLFQYVPRVIQIFQSWKDPKKRVDKSSETPKRVKAAFNFFLYIISSHVLGAFWYFLSIERETACWHRACEIHTGCIESSFKCDDRLHSLGNYTFLNDVCPINPPDKTRFDFGIFLGALQSGVVQSKNFSEKFFHCFWWGLQNLSSLGQNLETSNYVWEKCFAVLISLFGLLLFTYFIGNLQLYMQLDSSKSEEAKKKREEKEERMEMEMKEKKRTIEIWMFKYRLPGEMKRQIMQNAMQILKKNKSLVHVENLLRQLPEGLSNSVKRHIYLDLLKKVPALQNMDEQLLLKICDSLRPVYYNEQSYIVRERDPVDATIFITDGVAWSYSTSNNGEAISGSSSLAERLEKGDFFGGELIEFVLKNPSLPKLAISPRTVKTHGPIEGFALMAEDLKNIVTKNWKCVGKGQLEPFAAHVVQAAWRRHHEKSSQGGR